MKNFYAFIRRIITIGILVGALLAIYFVKKTPATAEKVTSEYIRFYSQYSTMISAYVPWFSLTEVLIAIIVIVLVCQILAFVIGLFKGKPFKAINHILSGGIFVLIVAVWYSATCQFAYNRDTMPLPFYETKVEKTEFVSIYNYYANDLNACISSLEFDENGEIKNDVDLATLAEEVATAHSFASDPYFYEFNGSVKPLLSSFALVEFQITGMAFSPLGEANINTKTPRVSLPMTVAHEIAHTRGVMREDDANQLAFYVCLNSSSPYLRYSAYLSRFNQLEAMVSTTYLSEAERAGLQTIDPIFAQSLNYVNSFWEKHDAMGNIGEAINDFYIKLSGVEEGTQSYNGGSEIGIDPETLELVPSLYQKLFFEKYYRV